MKPAVERVKKGYQDGESKSHQSHGHGRRSSICTLVFRLALRPVDRSAGGRVPGHVQEHAGPADMGTDHVHLRCTDRSLTQHEGPCLGRNSQALGKIKSVHAGVQTDQG